jgi:hypothetical protein
MTQDAETLIPLSQDDVTKWKSRIEKSAELLKNRHRSEWRENTGALETRPLKEKPEKDLIVVNKDLPRVKQKMAQLFYQVPEVQLKPRREDYAPAAQVFQPVLNFFLTKRIKTDVMMREVLTDVLGVSGIGVSKLGYECVTEDVQMPMQDASQLPPELQLSALQQEPQMETVPRCIYENYFWNRISPAKFVFPDEFTGSDFDEASWLGFEFRIPLEEAKRKYGLSDDFQGSGPDENLVSAVSEDKQRAQGTSTVRGWEIWYKAALFDPSVKHPCQHRVLVIIDGKDEPVRHRDSPYQKYDPMTGKLMGMHRFPIRVLTLTYIPDTAIPPSDTSVSRPQVRELWRSRTQMLEQRQKSMPWRWADKSRLDDQTLESIEAGEPQDIIMTDGPGDQVIGEVARANYPSEKFEFDRVIEGDIAEQWAMGRNQLGMETTGETTKAEVQTMQGNAGVRLDYERNLVLRYWLAGVEEVATLIQMFADDEDYVEIVGPQGQATIAPWDRTKVAGEFLFDVKPDSALRIDAVQERADSIHLYQMMANDPFINRFKLAEAVVRRHNLDPTHIMQQPPPKNPPEPNISYRFSGTDFLTPALPLILKILEKGGIVIDPETVANVLDAQHSGLYAEHVPGQGSGPDTKHGGPAEQVQPISKHQFTQGGL